MTISTSQLLWISAEVGLKFRNVLPALLHHFMPMLNEQCFVRTQHQVFLEDIFADDL